jgi:hypothetical protein
MRSARWLEQTCHPFATQLRSTDRMTMHTQLVKCWFQNALRRLNRPSLPGKKSRLGSPNSSRNAHSRLSQLKPRSEQHPDRGFYLVCSVDGRVVRSQTAYPAVPIAARNEPRAASVSRNQRERGGVIWMLKILCLLYRMPKASIGKSARGLF